MHIDGDEIIIKTVKRHLTPYILNFLKATIAVAPVYFVVFLIAREFGGEVLSISLSILSFIVVTGFTIASLDYMHDKLVITNRRLICVDWKSLIKKQENEIQLSDIQNIKTSELGVFANFYIFRYGRLEVESAASQTSIIFSQCNDPKATKHLMLSAVQKMKDERKNRFLTNESSAIIDA